MNDSFQVKIQTPEGVVWEGDVQALSSRNSMGSFDILPDHANIITLVEGEPISVVTATGSREFKFDRAIISVKDNVAAVYAEIAVKQSDITK